jgi:SPP1 gp7 family putative phage head morphogenesis protein
MAQPPQMGTNQSQPDGPTVQQVTMVLASGVPPASMVVVLAGLFGAFGITVSVITAVLALALKSARALPGTGSPGPAVTASLNAEAAFRAAYFVNAAARIQNNVNAGMALPDAIAGESNNLALHNAAQLNRRNAALEVDKAAVNGICGWKAKMDAKTSPECRAANGLNFRVSDPPSIGWPGAVHPHCRCRPTRPHLGAGWVQDALTPALVGAH